MRSTKIFGGLQVVTTRRPNIVRYSQLASEYPTLIKQKAHYTNNQQKKPENICFAKIKLW